MLARLTFAGPQHHAGRVYVGMPFLIREGAKTVGYGVVTFLLDREPSATKRDNQPGIGADRPVTTP